MIHPYDDRVLEVVERESEKALRNILTVMTDLQYSRSCKTLLCFLSKIQREIIKELADGEYDDKTVEDVVYIICDKIEHIQLEVEKIFE